MNFPRTLALTCAALFLATGIAQAKPLVYVTGTVTYNPEKAFNSYIIMATRKTTKMIDRNGNLVKEWDNRQPNNTMPSKAFPGGYVGAFIRSSPQGRRTTILWPSLTSTATSF